MVTDFIFLGSKITEDGDFSHEIKGHLLLGRKAMAKLDSILKSKDITLPIKVCLVKAIFFPVVMYGCESWTIKKAEHQRIDDFKLWCWRRLLRVPWTARRSNQSILKEISSAFSLEGLMLKLKLQYFGHLILRSDSLEKTLMLGKIEGRKRRGTTEDEMVGWHHWLDGHEFEQAPGVGDGQGSLVCYSPWGRQESDSTKQLNWTNCRDFAGNPVVKALPSVAESSSACGVGSVTVQGVNIPHASRPKSQNRQGKQYCNKFNDCTFSLILHLF